MRDRSALIPSRYRALTASNNSNYVAMLIRLATCCPPNLHAPGNKPPEATTDAGNNQCEAMRHGGELAGDEGGCRAPAENHAAMSRNKHRTASHHKEADR